MSFTIYDASVPVFVHSMTSIQAWLDKALAEGKSETALLESRLAPDMRPFPAQIQMASDSAKNGFSTSARQISSQPLLEADHLIEPFISVG